MEAVNFPVTLFITILIHNISIITPGHTVIGINILSKLYKTMYIDSHLFCFMGSGTSMTPEGERKIKDELIISTHMHNFCGLFWVFEDPTSRLVLVKGRTEGCTLGANSLGGWGEFPLHFR